MRHPQSGASCHPRSLSSRGISAAASSSRIEQPHRRHSGTRSPYDPSPPATNPTLRHPQRSQRISTWPVGQVAIPGECRPAASPGVGNALRQPGSQHEASPRLRPTAAPASLRPRHTRALSSRPSRSRVERSCNPSAKPIPCSCLVALVERERKQGIAGGDGMRDVSTALDMTKRRMWHEGTGRRANGRSFDSAQDDGLCQDHGL
jgi:hypothetical protein